MARYVLFIPAPAPKPQGPVRRKMKRKKNRSAGKKFYKDFGIFFPPTCFSKTPVFKKKEC